MTGWVGGGLLMLGLWAQPLAAQNYPDFTGLVERNIPSVVHIAVERRYPISAFLPDDESHARLNERMRDFAETEQTHRVSGSGFIIDADGHILTNFHVVARARDITVRLRDRRELNAVVVGYDESTDIALIKVDAEELAPVAIGSSYDLKLGEWVVAIGSPFDFEHSVTAGIISAKNRSFRGQQYVPFLQTDVPINQGNSGGPLINTAGEVVGINSQIYSGGSGYMGLSFAIPIEVATSVAQQLREFGEVSRGRLGVQIEDLTREQAETMGLRVPRGAMVMRVVPDSAASRADIRVGDVILEFNGQALTVSASLPPLVGATAPGTASTLVILRDGKRKSVQAVIDRWSPRES